MKSIAVVILALACAPVLAGCHDEQANAPTPLPGVVQQSGVTLESSYGTSLEFQTTYTVLLNEGRMLRIETTLTEYTSLYENGIQFEAHVSQPDGAWIDFDCEKIADKIIEPGLVPELDHWCKAIHDPAMAFWKVNNPPSSFTDGKGRVWVLKTN